MKAFISFKGIVCLFCFILMVSSIRAQNSSVSIGTETLKDKAVLWLKATGNQGLLLPVVSRSSFTGLNNSDEKGMLIFDPTDNKIYFWNGATWVEAGGGVGINQTLTLSGNTFTLTGSPASTVPLANNTPTVGQALIWNGTAWTAASLTGDASGAFTSTQVTGLRGKVLPSLPASTQALVYDGSAWTFQTITGGGGEANTASNVGTAGVGIFKQKTGVNLELQKINAGSNRISVTQDAVNSEVDVDVNQANLSIASTQVTGLGTLATLGTVGSAQITDAAIQDIDIANNTITSGKLAPSGATTGQVLKYNGAIWAPASDDVGSGSTPTLANGQILTGNGTTNAASTLTGDATLSGGTITIAANAITSAEITDGSVTSADITDGTIADADIANVAPGKLTQATAVSGQVLKWNGAAWTPAADDGTTYTPGTGISIAGTTITNTGDTNAADDLTTASVAAGDVTGLFSALQIASGTVTSTEIADGSITSTDITDGTIVAADINNLGAVSGQVLKYNGANWAPAADNTGVSSTLASANILVGNASNVATAVTMSGDATLNNTGALTISTDAITSSKILNATLVDADVSPTAAIAGTKINPAFGAQAISTTGAATIGGGVSAGAANQFTINATGNITKINNVATSFPSAQGAANTVLVNDGTGTLTWGVTPSFSTLNVIPKGNGTTLVASSIFDNGSIGINSNNPQADLHVNGTATGSIRLTNSASGSTTADGLELQLDNAGASTIFSHESGLMTIGTGSNGTLYLTSGGTVGINNNNPVQPLDVSGNVQFSGALLPAGIPGVAGQILTSQGPGVAPTWANASGGDLQSAYDGGNTITGANAIVLTLDNGLVAQGTFGTGSIPTTGAGTRMMFYPRKAAFRAGRTFNDTGTESQNWDDANVGDDSFAAGRNTMASGIRSFAVGKGSKAAGSAAVAMGDGTQANEFTSVAMGFGTVANGQESFAMGRYTVASSRGGIAFGYFNVSGGNATTFVSTDPLFELGNGTDFSARSNAFTVLKNGKTSINGSNPAVMLEINGTDAIKLPVGLSTERPSVPVAGHLRYNSTNSLLEFYNGSAWQNLSTGSGSALINNTGTSNLFAGDLVSTSGTDNGIFGFRAGTANTGNYNVFVGTQAAENKTTGDLNTIIGWRAGRTASAAGNTLIGAQAGQNLSTGSVNTFLGEKAGLNTTTGSQSVFIGNSAGDTNTNGAQHTIIGNQADVGAVGLLNASAIGYRAYVNQSNSLVLGGINGVNGATADTNVGIGTSTPTTKLDVVGNTTITGNLSVSGSLSKGSGTFKIDHPLDPENKFLYHSFVESPDMMNVYNGNIQTNSEGIAEVELPGYFEALNKDYRYQLTVIGEFAQAIVLKKVRDNKFTIKTDKPNIEVSWQVTGIRKDPYAEKNRVEVEVEKTGADKGTYLHPEAYGISRENP